MRRLAGLFLVGWSLMAAACMSLAEPADARQTGVPAQPNIVLILADDLGWADLPALAPSPYSTPHLDRLVERGVLFTDVYAYPVCSPSRAQLLTGQNPARFGLTDFLPGHWRRFEALATPVMPEHLPLEAQSLARLLEAGGYRTGYFGKWHLGDPGTAGPGQFGYGEWIVTRGGHSAGRYGTTPEHPARHDVPLSSFLTDRFADFIDREPDVPFYVELHPYLVHIPLEADAKAVAAAEARLEAADVPGQRSAVYAAMVTELDAMVGDVIAHLEAAGELDSTAIFFLSDNGGLIRRFDGAGPVVTSNAPLRGEKGNVFEGGIRVPLIAAWPGRFAAGTTVTAPGSLSDILPTVLDLAGSDADFESDGRSLVPLLTGAQAGAEPAPPIIVHYPHYHHGQPASAIREGDWKLVRHWADGEEMLFDLASDMSEARDVKAAHPDIHNQLAASLDQALRDFGARMPRANEEHDPARADQWWIRQQLTPEMLDRLLERRE